MEQQQHRFHSVVSGMMSSLGSGVNSQKSSVRTSDMKIRQLKVAKTDDMEKSQTFQDFMRTYFYYKIIEFVQIDSIRHVDERFIRLIGIAIWVTYVSMYLYFFITQLVQNSPYIASSGSINNFVKCIPIDRPLTGTFQVDSNGRWSTDSLYSSVRYIYAFRFYDLKSSENYQLFLTKVQTEIERIGKLARTQVLTTNLLYWNNFLYTLYLDGHKNEFEFSGEANILWNMNSFAVAMVLNRSFCSPTQLTYDIFSSNLDMLYDYSDYKSNCENITSASAISFNNERLSKDITIKVDFRSFMLPVGVNSNISDLNQLEEIPDKKLLLGETITYNGAVYSKKIMVDVRFPRHTPFVCYNQISGSDTISAYPFESYCFVRLGRAMAIPFYTHFGSLNAPCNCTAPDNYCNDFDFLATMLYFPGVSTDVNFSYYEDSFRGISNMTKLFDVVTKYGRDELTEIVQAASRKALTSKNFANFFPVYDIIDDDDPTAFCDHKCVLYVINGYNQFNTYSKAISDTFYQVEYGHCNDSFTTKSIGNLFSQVPESMTEKYVECTDGNYYKFLNALGISNGNVQIAIPIFITCVIPLVYAWLHYTNRIPEREKYSKNERDVAMDALADIILSVRDLDGNVPGLSESNPVRSLAQGLIDYAHEYDGEQLRVHVQSTVESPHRIVKQSSGRIVKQSSGIFLKKEVGRTAIRKSSIFVKGDTKIAPAP